jgi:predicted DsbA family dithiol-disulfide isomerase
VLEAATRQFGAKLALRWHAYELRPEPFPQPDPDSEYIREHWEQRVLPMAARRGLTMRVPRRQIRSRRALQAALFAQEHGCFAQLDPLIFRARFERDDDISSMDVLRRLGVEAARAGGQSAGDAAAFGESLVYSVTSNACLDSLTADLTLAARLGISGVPAALVGPENGDLDAFFADAEPLIGAVPHEWLTEAIERALSGERGHPRLRRP